MKHVLFIAAENGAIAGGKVGGLGDVIRDVPMELSEQGVRVSVITPGYGVLAERVAASDEVSIDIPFAGGKETVALRKNATIDIAGQLSYYFIEHPQLIAPGKGRIYSSDDAGPFATDATRFALFCAAVASLIETGGLPRPDYIHCHDWHTGPFLILRACSMQYRSLRDIPVIFSIHNLALQGVRPFSGDPSSLKTWFPDIKVEPEQIADPRYSDCVNFMRAGINLADRVHTVSPGYCKEILEPSRPEQGFVGGEGLESDLQKVADQGRLFGILNGCIYTKTRVSKPVNAEVWRLVDDCLDAWATASPRIASDYYFAYRRLMQWKSRRSAMQPVLLSVGRLVDQKVSLLCGSYKQHTVMDELLETIRPGIFIMLGSGDKYYEDFFADMMIKHSNFLFLRGYSDELAETLYRFGDLFVMPSLFEPCGISQLLAMRAGMPCLVNSVGGLADTVVDGKTGFVFSGEGIESKAEALLKSLQQALALYREQPVQWKKVCTAARTERFDWSRSVAEYLSKLYVPVPKPKPVRQPKARVQASARKRKTAKAK